MSVDQKIKRIDAGIDRLIAERDRLREVNRELRGALTKFMDASALIVGSWDSPYIPSTWVAKQQALDEAIKQASAALHKAGSHV